MIGLFSRAGRSESVEIPYFAEIGVGDRGLKGVHGRCHPLAGLVDHVGICQVIPSNVARRIRINRVVHCLRR